MPTDPHPPTEAPETEDDERVMLAGLGFDPDYTVVVSDEGEDEEDDD